MLDALLQKNPSQRLGSGPNDSLDVEGHEFFCNVNFDDVLNKKIRAPWVPILFSDTDTSNFNKKYTRVSVSDSPPNSEGAIRIPSFDGFTYDNLNA